MPQTKRPARRPELAPLGAPLLTDPQAAAELGVGLTKFYQLAQGDPDFPAPIKFGPRSTRRLRTALHEYAIKRMAVSA